MIQDGNDRPNLIVRKCVKVHDAYGPSWSIGCNGRHLRICLCEVNTGRTQENRNEETTNSRFREI